MSYRAFKKLLGETSLERKCRWLLGAGVLVLMTGSFWIYARQTEDLAFEQLETTGRALLPTIMAQLHVKGEQRAAVLDFQKTSEKQWPAQFQGYNYKLIKPFSTDPQYQAAADDQNTLWGFLSEPHKIEESRPVAKENAFYYYGALRAAPSCIDCHTNKEKMGGEDKVRKDLKPDDLMGVVRIRLSTQAIKEGFHTNRALLISFAIGTSLLIIAGSDLIIRYVIVNPVKHCKQVSSAIA